MRRTPALLLLAAALLLPTSAQAASGALDDPDDSSIADIVQLSYANKSDRVVMRMTYDELRPQVENFQVRWGTTGTYYKLQRSEADGTVLWFSNGSSESRRRCAGDSVTYDADSFVSTAVIPRSCLPQAPNRVKFRGIVTVGLFDSDTTRTSGAVARG